ncbi:MAG: cysteine desulfurase [Candidatus Woesearchaeota archaeon]|jgi:cysteine desulfurase/selenocysteine lyase|nr:cysteine desulfurase [Candidatus Woesearchaeota archaeon]MDP7324301.1 cysteine desulfurase [Candidatus Woesearchaeota archaeon]MDP7457800.1 cysteine desulfurase [Candidatus Woesearchaeota archaeon]
MMDNEKAKELREDFPIFRSEMNKQKLIYLDNAATTQKPEVVIDKITKYYENENANIHRGIYKLSEEATKSYENAHKTVANLVKASPHEIIFTRNTTESLNLLAYTLGSVAKGKDIVLTELEHHSNIVPWQELAKRNNMKIKFIPVKADFTLDYAKAEKLITENTAIVSMNHVSNAVGTINNVKKIMKLGKSNGAITILDGAQSAPHMEIDVKELGCDFFAFSGHKMLGPTGIGALYGNKALLEKMPPFLSGGDMIRTVSFDKSTWNDLPWKYEAGTPNIAGGICFATAIDYLKKVGLKNIDRWERELIAYALEEVAKIKSIKLFNPGVKNSAGILSFNLGNIHAHDVSSLLDAEGICIRGGHHCAMPLMTKLGITGTSRASFYLYNTMEDVDALITALKKSEEVFK